MWRVLCDNLQPGLAGTHRDQLCNSVGLFQHSPETPNTQRGRWGQPTSICAVTKRCTSLSLASSTRCSSSPCWWLRAMLWGGTRTLAPTHPSEAAEGVWGAGSPRQGQLGERSSRDPPAAAAAAVPAGSAAPGPRRAAARPCRARPHACGDSRAGAGVRPRYRGCRPLGPRTARGSLRLRLGLPGAGHPARMCPAVRVRPFCRPIRDCRGSPTPNISKIAAPAAGGYAESTQVSLHGPFRAPSLSPSLLS